MRSIFILSFFMFECAIANVPQCQNDIAKLKCPKGQDIVCLEQHVSELSEACLAVNPTLKSTKTVMDSCKTEGAKNCSGKYSMELITCLEDFVVSEVKKNTYYSGACLETLKENNMAFKSNIKKIVDNQQVIEAKQRADKKAADVLAEFEKKKKAAEEELQKYRKTRYQECIERVKKEKMHDMTQEQLCRSYSSQKIPTEDVKICVQTNIDSFVKKNRLKESDKIYAEMALQDDCISYGADTEWLQCVKKQISGVRSKDMHDLLSRCDLLYKRCATDFASTSKFVHNFCNTYRTWYVKSSECLEDQAQYWEDFFKAPRTEKHVKETIDEWFYKCNEIEKSHRTFTECIKQTYKKPIFRSTMSTMAEYCSLNNQTLQNCVIKLGYTSAYNNLMFSYTLRPLIEKCIEENSCDKCSK